MMSRRIWITILLSFLMVKLIPDIILTVLLALLLSNNTVAFRVIEYIEKNIERYIPDRVPQQDLTTNKYGKVPIQPQKCIGKLANGEPCHYRAKEDGYCGIHIKQRVLQLSV